MSRKGNPTPIQGRQRAEAQARAHSAERVTEEVVIYFLEPQVPTPCWRRARPEEYARIFREAKFEIIPTQTATLIRVTRGQGRIKDVFDWDSVDRVFTYPAPVTAPELTLNERVDRLATALEEEEGS